VAPVDANRRGTSYGSDVGPFSDIILAAIGTSSGSARTGSTIFRPKRQKNSARRLA
jgi:hypothetical protein